MPDDPSPAAASLSARAAEILRRADAQLTALRAPAPALPDPPAPEEPPEPEAETLVRERDPSLPEEVSDLGQLLDTVEAGIEAARAHLVALSASLERVAEELVSAAEEHRRSLPPALAGHARLPEDLTTPRSPDPGPVPVDEPEAEPVAEAPSTDAAHDAARLVAIEMAVAGDTREGVGRRLRDEFGIRDPRGILDDAFGPDAGGPGRRSYGA